MTAVGFEPTLLRTGALSQRLRPLGQTVLGGKGKSELKNAMNNLQSEGTSQDRS